MKGTLTHIQSPNASSGPQIEDPLRILRDGREMKLAATSDCENVMKEI